MEKYDEQLSFDGLVHEVIVVDDGSSNEDRIKMRSRNPNFKFIFKNESQKGHAHSMNILVEHVKTEYFIYIEDDWQYRGMMPFSQYILEAKDILDSYANNIFESELKVNQILFNEQSQRSCAVADMEKCKFGEGMYYGGWYREKEMSNVEQLGLRCRQDRKNKQCIYPLIHYSIHEGSLFPLNFLNEYIDQEFEDLRQDAIRRGIHTQTHTYIHTYT